MSGCSGSAGFMGYARVCGKVLPYLSADLTKVTEILMSDSIHGGGVGNTDPVFNSQINFSIGRVIAEGSVTVEVFAGTGNYGAAFTNMLQRSIPSSSDMTNICNGFNSACKLVFSPGGGSEITLPGSVGAVAKAMVSSMELRGNPGGNVQATFSITSAGADFSVTPTLAPAVSDLAFESIGLSDDSNPVPYYASDFTVTGSGEATLTDRIMDWNITVNNNPTPIYTFNGTNSALDIILGMRQVSGTFTYYAPNGQFVENLTHGATATINFGTTVIHLPFLVFDRCPIPSPGPNAPCTRQVNFRGVAAGAGLPSIYYS